jgi:hypothetical protein
MDKIAERQNGFHNTAMVRVPEILWTDRGKAYGAFVWALDFFRAMRERPLWAKYLMRFVMGKYAYREFIGLHDALIDSGYSPHYGGVGEGVDYYKDKVPFDWWRDTEGKRFVTKATE